MTRPRECDREKPIEYGAGDTMTESAALHHWIENIGTEPLIGVVIDIPNTGNAPKFTDDQILKAYGFKRHEHK